MRGREDRTFAVAFAIWVLAWLLGAAFWGVVAYVVLHFLTKFW